MFMIVEWETNERWRDFSVYINPYGGNSPQMAMCCNH